LASPLWSLRTNPRAPRREIDNTAAFARLYGVVRFFYPSDAAADFRLEPLRHVRRTAHTSCEGLVDDDATNIAFGVMASGSVVADFAAIDLSVRDVGGNWVKVAIKDPGFEAGADAGTAGWVRAGSSNRAEITRRQRARGPSVPAICSVSCSRLEC
jgi:hypothetical protein